MTARPQLASGSRLILTLARLLHINGQATEQTVGAAEEVGRSLGIRATIIPRWGELELRAEEKGGSLLTSVPADPNGVDMNWVASAMRAVRDLGAGRLAPDTAIQALGTISRAPQAPTTLFALAAGAGAAALAVIFGVAHWTPVILIFAEGTSYDPTTREPHTSVAHDRPAGDRRVASDYRHLYNHRLSRPISAAACWLALRSTPRAGDDLRREGLAIPHDRQRSGLAARSAVAAVTVPVWPHLAQRTGHEWGNGSNMAVTV